MSVVAEGEGYRECFYTHLHLQKDGSYAGFRNRFVPANVGYKGVREPVSVSAERLAEAEQIARKWSRENGQAIVHIHLVAMTCTGPDSD